MAQRMGGGGRGKSRKELAKPAAKNGKARAAADDDAVEADGEEKPAVEFDPEKFREHVDNVLNLKSKGAEIRGKIGAAVKNAEDDYGIHRGAAALCIKLKGMTEENRAAFLKSFDDMRTALGWAHQADLFETDAERSTFAGRSV